MAGRRFRELKCLQLKIVFRPQWHILDPIKIYCNSNHVTPVIAIIDSQIARDSIIVQDFYFSFRWKFIRKREP